ncbi:MAG TPA: hypothetical protein VG815_19105, partial [Chloroflexota bacterium]|nr:hypothetical protein [Chloroflexota bacterium]
TSDGGSVAVSASVIVGRGSGIFAAAAFTEELRGSFSASNSLKWGSFRANSVPCGTFPRSFAAIAPRLLGVVCPSSALLAVELRRSLWSDRPALRGR